MPKILMNSIPEEESKDGENLEGLELDDDVDKIIDDDN